MASAAPNSVAFKFDVHFEPRPEGGLRAYCDDIPGFVLSNSSAEVVMDGVIPVLEVIISEMFNSPINVRPVLDIRDAIEGTGLRAERQLNQRVVEYVTQPAC